MSCPMDVGQANSQGSNGLPILLLPSPRQTQSKVAKEEEENVYKRACLLKKSVYPFTHMPFERVLRIASNSLDLRVSSDEYLFREGESANWIYAVVGGSLTLVAESTKSLSPLVSSQVTYNFASPNESNIPYPPFSQPFQLPLSSSSSSSSSHTYGLDPLGSRARQRAITSCPSASKSLHIQHHSIEKPTTSDSQTNEYTTNQGRSRRRYGRVLIAKGEGAKGSNITKGSHARIRKEKVSEGVQTTVNEIMNRSAPYRLLMDRALGIDGTEVDTSHTIRGIEYHQQLFRESIKKLAKDGQTTSTPLDYGPRSTTTIGRTNATSHHQLTKDKHSTFPMTTSEDGNKKSSLLANSYTHSHETTTKVGTPDALNQFLHPITKIQELRNKFSPTGAVEPYERVTYKVRVPSRDRYIRVSVVPLRVDGTEIQPKASHHDLRSSSSSKELVVRSNLLSTHSSSLTSFRDIAPSNNNTTQQLMTKSGLQQTNNPFTIPYDVCEYNQDQTGPASTRRSTSPDLGRSSQGTLLLEDDPERPAIVEETTKLLDAPSASIATQPTHPTELLITMDQTHSSLPTDKQESTVYGDRGDYLFMKGLELYACSTSVHPTKSQCTWRGKHYNPDIHGEIDMTSDRQNNNNRVTTLTSPLSVNKITSPLSLSSQGQGRGQGASVDPSPSPRSTRSTNQTPFLSTALITHPDSNPSPFLHNNHQSGSTDEAKGILTRSPTHSQHTSLSLSHRRTPSESHNRQIHLSQRRAIHPSAVLTIPAGVSSPGSWVFISVVGGSTLPSELNFRIMLEYPRADGPEQWSKPSQPIPLLSLPLFSLVGVSEVLGQQMKTSMDVATETTTTITTTTTTPTLPTHDNSMITVDRQWMYSARSDSALHVIAVPFSIFLWAIQKSTMVGELVKLAKTHDDLIRHYAKSRLEQEDVKQQISEPFKSASLEDIAGDRIIYGRAVHDDIIISPQSSSTTTTTTTIIHGSGSGSGGGSGKSSSQTLVNFPLRPALPSSGTKELLQDVLTLTHSPSTRRNMDIKQKYSKDVSAPPPPGLTKQVAEAMTDPTIITHGSASECYRRGKEAKRNRTQAILKGLVDKAKYYIHGEGEQNQSPTDDIEPSSSSPTTPPDTDEGDNGHSDKNEENMIHLHVDKDHDPKKKSKVLLAALYEIAQNRPSLALIDPDEVPPSQADQIRESFINRLQRESGLSSEVDDKEIKSIPNETLPRHAHEHRLHSLLTQKAMKSAPKNMILNYAPVTSPLKLPSCYLNDTTTSSTVTPSSTTNLKPNNNYETKLISDCTTNPHVSPISLISPINGTISPVNNNSKNNNNNNHSLSTETQGGNVSRMSRASRQYSWRHGLGGKWSMRVAAESERRASLELSQGLRRAVDIATVSHTCGYGTSQVFREDTTSTHTKDALTTHQLDEANLPAPSLAPHIHGHDIQTVARTLIIPSVKPRAQSLIRDSHADAAERLLLSAQTYTSTAGASSPVNLVTEPMNQMEGDKVIANDKEQQVKEASTSNTKDPSTCSTSMRQRPKSAHHLQTQTTSTLTSLRRPVSAYLPRSSQSSSYQPSATQSIGLSPNNIEDNNHDNDNDKDNDKQSLRHTLTSPPTRSQGPDLSHRVYNYQKTRITSEDRARSHLADADTILRTIGLLPKGRVDSGQCNKISEMGISPPPPPPPSGSTSLTNVPVMTSVQLEAPALDMTTSTNTNNYHRADTTNSQERSPEPVVGGGREEAIDLTLTTNTTPLPRYRADIDSLISQPSMVSFLSMTGAITDIHDDSDPETGSNNNNDNKNKKSNNNNNNNASSSHNIRRQRKCSSQTMTIPDRSTILTPPQSSHAPCSDPAIHPHLSNMTIRTFARRSTTAMAPTFEYLSAIRSNNISGLHDSKEMHLEVDAGVLKSTLNSVARRVLGNTTKEMNNNKVEVDNKITDGTVSECRPQVPSPAIHIGPPQVTDGSVFKLTAAEDADADADALEETGNVPTSSSLLVPVIAKNAEPINHVGAMDTSSIPDPLIMSARGYPEKTQSGSHHNSGGIRTRRPLSALPSKTYVSPLATNSVPTTSQTSDGLPASYANSSEPKGPNQTSETSLYKPSCHPIDASLKAYNVLVTKKLRSALARNGLLSKSERKSEVIPGNSNEQTNQQTMYDISLPIRPEERARKALQFKRSRPQILRKQVEALHHLSLPPRAPETLLDDS